MPSAKPPKKKSKRKKKSKAAPREKVPPPRRFEPPLENQDSSISSRENEPVPERPRKRVSWPPERDLKKVEEVSRYMNDAWGKFLGFQDRWKWSDGKHVNIFPFKCQYKQEYVYFEKIKDIKE